MPIRRVIKFALAILTTSVLACVNASANTEMVTSPNSYAGLNQYQRDVTFPEFDSIKIIGTHIGIASRLEGVNNPKKRRKVKKFEQRVTEQLSAALHKATEEMMSTSLNLPVVEEYVATTLVMRPSVTDFEIGHGGGKVYSSPDEIIISIEVFDVVKGGVLAMASSKTMIPRDQLFYERGMKQKKAKEASELIAEIQKEMLLAMFKDIKESHLKTN